MNSVQDGVLMRSDPLKRRRQGDGLAVYEDDCMKAILVADRRTEGRPFTWHDYCSIGVWQYRYFLTTTEGYPRMRSSFVVISSKGQWPPLIPAVCTIEFYNSSRMRASTRAGKKLETGRAEENSAGLSVTTW